MEKSMSSDPYDPKYQPELQLAPVTSGSEPGIGRRWLSQVVTQIAQPMRRSKPEWVHLPDRVWQRQSALLVSLHERKRH
jgi:hypothetical protein